MDKIIAAIKERIEECKRTGGVFDMSEVEGCVVEKHELPNSGAMTRHLEYVLTLKDGCSVRIDCQSKDKSHSHHYERETSYIKVECSDRSNDFSDSWEERV